MLTLLDRLIEERAEYTYWMSQKSTDDISRTATENHLHYIEVLKETKTILAKRMELEATVTTRTESSHTKPTTKPSQTNNSILGKRRAYSTTLHDSDQKKAAKTEATKATPAHVLFKGANPAAATEKTPQQAEWRQIIANNCSSTTDNKGATAKKPMSYAAAARAITA